MKRKFTEEEQRELDNARNVLMRIVGPEITAQMFANIYDEEKSKADFYNLPDAVLANILNNLSVEQLSLFKRLNKRFYGIIKGYQLIERQRPVLTFGNGTYGALGDGITTRHFIPTPVLLPNIYSIAKVSCGNEYTAIVTTNGRLFTCGRDYGGKLGHGRSTGDHSVGEPTLIDYLPPIATVSCGSNHTACVTTDGLLYTCGETKGGKLGNGIVHNSNVGTFTLVSDLPRVKDVSCGARHTAIVTIYGQLYSCGDGKDGKLGDGRIDEHLVGRFTLVSDFFKITEDGESGEHHTAVVTEVACGAYHTVVVTTEGFVYTCGFGYSGQLGNGKRGVRNKVGTLTLIHRQPPIAKVSCGGRYTACITSHGLVYSCGNGDWGKLGNGIITQHDVTTLTLISGLPPIANVSCGSIHTAYVTTKGLLYTCGSGWGGTLGDGIDKDHDVGTPTLVTNLPLITSASCGPSHTAIIAGHPIGNSPLKIADRVPTCSICETVTNTRCQDCDLELCSKCFPKLHL